MADDDIAFAGAARQAEMVRSGEVSPRELVGLHLDRIQRLDPELNSFRKVLAERAMLEAEQAEARLKAGEERPLLGVPIAIKDEVDVAGEVNTHRHRRLRPSPPRTTARWCAGCARQVRSSSASPCCRRWRSAVSPSRRPTALPRNPWNRQRSPGGLQRRLRCRGRGGPGPDRLSRRRRRLDPHPGRLLWALWAEALAWPGLLRARA